MKHRAPESASLLRAEAAMLFGIHGFFAVSMLATLAFGLESGLRFGLGALVLAGCLGFLTGPTFWRHVRPLRYHWLHGFLTPAPGPRRGTRR